MELQNETKVEITTETQIREKTHLEITVEKQIQNEDDKVIILPGDIMEHEELCLLFEKLSTKGEIQLLLFFAERNVPLNTIKSFNSIKNMTKEIESSISEDKSVLEVLDKCKPRLLSFGFVTTMGVCNKSVLEIYERFKLNIFNYYHYIHNINLYEEDLVVTILPDPLVLPEGDINERRFAVCIKVPLKKFAYRNYDEHFCDMQRFWESMERRNDTENLWSRISPWDAMIYPHWMKRGTIHQIGTKDLKRNDFLSEKLTEENIGIVSQPLTILPKYDKNIHYITTNTTKTPVLHGPRENIANFMAPEVATGDEKKKRFLNTFSKIFCGEFSENEKDWLKETKITVKETKRKFGSIWTIQQEDNSKTVIFDEFMQEKYIKEGPSREQTSTFHSNYFVWMTANYPTENKLAITAIKDVLFDTYSVEKKKIGGIWFYHGIKIKN